MKSLLKLKQTKGFTLVEILIVVIIVGLLAGIAVSKLGDNKERAVQSVKKSAAAEINKAVQAAYVKGYLPTATVANGTPGTPGAAGVVALVGQLQALGSNAPFTAASAAEMQNNIADTTANSGSLYVTGGGTGTGLRDVEVVYSASVDQN